MSNSAEGAQVCSACGREKVLSLFPKWRLKCKACKSAENSARLKERYATDKKFVKATKQRAADWQRENAEKSNEYHRRRHAAKVAAGDRDYLLKSSEATKRYYRSKKGKAATAAREARYVASGQDKVWRNARRQKPESRTAQMLSHTRTRALKADFEFALTFDDIYPVVARGVCQVTGTVFDLAAHSKHRTNPFAPSIDRIDSSKGYVANNVRVVCWWLNCACGVWGLEAIIPGMRAIVDTNRTKDV